jgi:hypothetical protein
LFETLKNDVSKISSNPESLGQLNSAASTIPPAPDGAGAAPAATEPPQTPDVPGAASPGTDESAFRSSDNGQGLFAHIHLDGTPMPVAKPEVASLSDGEEVRPLPTGGLSGKTARASLS